jgi:hypothetical protein
VHQHSSHHNAIYSYLKCQVLDHKDPRSTQRYNHLEIDMPDRCRREDRPEIDMMARKSPQKRKKPPIKVALISCPCSETRMDTTCTGEGGIQIIFSSPYK